MNNIIKEYKNYFRDNYRDLKPTIITYGSNSYGDNFNDLDVCIVIEGHLHEDEEISIIDFTREFSLRHGLRIDEEIPYKNKLLYTLNEVEEFVMSNPFITSKGNCMITDIEKTQQFLATRTMKHRLLLNILTTKHVVVYGNKQLISFCEYEAWKTIIRSLDLYYDNKLNSIDDYVKGMQTNLKTKCEGEYFLGYKNQIEKSEYLIEKLEEILPILL